MNSPKHTLSLRAAGWLILIAGAGIPAAALRGQTDATALAPVVITATRLPESSLTLGAAVDAVSGGDLLREQLTGVADALTLIPGASAFATGDRGAATSVFMRGSNSNQTLFLVDGIRLSDANTDYAVWLGGARLFPSDSLEVVHGAQSTLYGSEAVGGLISLHTQRGAGSPSERVSAEAGSFGTVQGTATAQGAARTWAYNIAASGDSTDNERLNNRFTSENVVLRLDRTLFPDLSIGATLRGLVERYGDPSDKYTNDRYTYEHENNWLATVFADGRISENFWTHLIVGGQDRRFLAVTPSPGQPDSITVVKNRRGVLDWQFTGQVTETNRLTAGITAEDATTRNTGFGDINRRQTLFAWFAQDEWSPVTDLYLTGGLRSDDYSTFGSATTGRATLAWLTGDHHVKFRASYATGFDSPSFLDLYGQNPYYQGNPHLLPEKSHGWDAGLDFYIPDGQGKLSATWFHTDFRDLIVYNFNVFPSTTANVNRAQTEGLELALTTPVAGLQAKIAYTLLKARDLTDQTALLRRPRNSGSIDLWQSFGSFTIGAGGTYVSRRPDVDALTFATVNDPDYTVVRAYAAWQATRHLALKVRVENALNNYYEPVNGYPALSRGVFGGAEYRF